MEIEAFSNTLYDEMEKELLKNNSSSNNLEYFRESSGIILKYISKLKLFINDYNFLNKAEEIYFFKYIKPKFLSRLIYFQNAYKIQFHLPLGAPDAVKNYYLTELEKINDYFKRDTEFYSYYRSQSNSLDEIYFIRKEPDPWLLLNIEDYETDLIFTTFYDQKISKILAFKKLSEFIKASINNLEIKPELFNREKLKEKNEINWTASKVSLVELLYALQSSGSFNNGKMDLKEMARNFEIFFNVDLGNYYRMFQDMRIRKINRTVFLDQLKNRLIQRMDEADENPKYK